MGFLDRQFRRECSHYHHHFIEGKERLRTVEFNYDFREPGAPMEMEIIHCTATDH